MQTIDFFRMFKNDVIEREKLPRNLRYFQSVISSYGYAGKGNYHNVYLRSGYRCGQDDHVISGKNVNDIRGRLMNLRVCYCANCVSVILFSDFSLLSLQGLRYVEKVIFQIQKKRKIAV